MDSKIFELALENQAKIIELKTAELFEELVETACNNTVDKAVEFKVKSLVDEAKKKMKAANPNYAKEYSMLADIKYAAGIGNLEEYGNLADKYLKKYAKKDAYTLHSYAHTFLMRISDKKLLEKAEKWAKQAATLDYNQQYLKTHAGILYKLGRTEESEKLLQKAKELGGSSWI